MCAEYFLSKIYNELNKIIIFVYVPSHCVIYNFWHLFCCQCNSFLVFATKRRRSFKKAMSRRTHVYLLNILRLLCLGSDVLKADGQTCWLAIQRHCKNTMDSGFFCWKRRHHCRLCHCDLLVRPSVCLFQLQQLKQRCLTDRRTGRPSFVVRGIERGGRISRPGRRPTRCNK